MGIVIENTNLCGSETHFPLEKIIRSRKKRKKAPVLVLHRIPAKHSEGAFICTVADLSHFNCEHSCWLLLSRADISAEHGHSCTLLQHVLTKKKSECCKYFERFTMSVTRVFNLGEKFNNSGSANEINGGGSGYQSRWKWKFVRRWRRNASACGFMISVIFISLQITSG